MLLLAIGAGVFVARTLKRRSGGAPTNDPDWPRFEPAVAAPGAPATAADPAPAAETTTVDAAEHPDWVEPVDGACPTGFEIKANDNSHIYHVPGGRFYERTVAERCYATETAAERDGYRRAKA